MTSPLDTFLALHPAAILVEVEAVQGSTPREAGAYMLVSAEALFGTIGGGQLEFLGIGHARAILNGEALPDMLDIPLGPEIGQCCGGRTQLRFSNLDAALAAALRNKQQAEENKFPQVLLFGAGHVGLALAQALRPLPLQVAVIETRDIAVADRPDGVAFRRVVMPEAEINGIAPGGAVVILTHDHALDFLIAREALARADLAYVGMIGSVTKRATFSHWLARQGGDPAWLSRLVLPIGGSTVRDKRPAVISAMAAAEILAALARWSPTD
ncbi:MAG: xanthine dehydrogenase accessory protein XdhC [Allorhizobium sp.]